MSEKIKNYLGMSLIVTSLAFAFASVGYVYNQPDYSERTFSVTGEGEAVVVPDIGTFTFSVLTEGGINPTSLQTQNNEQSNAVIEYLKSNGVDEKDIQSQDYSVSPRYQYSRCFDEDGICSPPEIVGYSIQHTVSVKVRNLENVGALLSGVVENGANNVSGLNFSADDPTQIENEARASAISQAKEKAKSIAKAGGFRLGKLISISENEPYYDYYADSVEGYNLGYGKGGDGPMAPSVEPGSEKIAISIMLIYEIR